MKETEEGIFLTPYDCAALATVAGLMAGLILVVGVLIGWMFL